MTGPLEGDRRSHTAGGRPSWGRTTRLWMVLGANLALVGALIVVGVKAHSLAVWAEGADYLADAAAIGVSLAAIRLDRRPGGRGRATRYAAGVNAAWLLGLSLLVAAGAADRLLAGTRQVHGLAVLVTSGIAAVVMLGGALLLGGDVDDDDGDEGAALNVRAVLVDTAADAAAAGGVALAGAIIVVAGGLYWLDPAVALVVSLVVGYHALRLLGRVRASLRAADAGGRPSA